MQKNTIKNNTSSNAPEGMFVSMDELNNMSFINGKPLSNGGIEVSNTKQWTKNIKDIETEQRNHEQIISEIRKLEEKINAILKMLETIEDNNMYINKDNTKNTETHTISNPTWKDRLKGIVK